MKLRFPVVAMLLASLLILAGVNLADAQWEAIGSGFAVTTDWHGKDVPIGLSVTATAGWAPSLAPPKLREVVVKTVEFVWHYPNGTVALSVSVPVSDPIVAPAVPPAPIPPEITKWALENPGVTYYYAQNAQIPVVAGDWGVQAIFHDSVRICGKNSDTVRIRSTSFNMVPEVPFGTVAILLSWIGVLGVFVIRKKHLRA